MTEAHRPGVREVVILAVAVVATVLGAAIATSLLPVDAQEVVFRSPLLIIVLMTGTAVVLWRVSRGKPPSA